MFVLREGDSGSYVSAMQLALFRAGYSVGPLDGQFGGRTLRALIKFQESYGLVTDGIAGVRTFEALRPFLTGYVAHSIKKGDTYFNLAKKYGSSVDKIRVANPGPDEDDLVIGQIINVPLNFSVVATNIPYNSYLCGLIAEGLAVRYPFIKLTQVGRSVEDNPLILLKIGRGGRKTFFNASHHANEWITTPLTLRFLEEYAKAFVTSGKIEGVDSERLYDTTTLYIMPLVNPDGVDLVTGATRKDNEAYLDVLALAENYPLIPFPSGWKANIRGVDLNLNYPAMWERAREIKYAAGFTKPGPRDFVGESPLSQPESRAVYDLSRKENFNITLSFHTQGEEIYWRFENYIPPGGKELGDEMARLSGYRLTDSGAFSSFAGYKDWFIMEYLRPGYTIEAGLGKNPLPITAFEGIYKDLKGVMAVALYYR